MQLRTPSLRKFKYFLYKKLVAIGALKQLFVGLSKQEFSRRNLYIRGLWKLKSNFLWTDDGAAIGPFALQYQ